MIYGDFESIARIEANESVPEKKVKELKAELDNKDIWEASFLRDNNFPLTQMNK